MACKLTKESIEVIADQVSYLAWKYEDDLEEFTKQFTEYLEGEGVIVVIE